jgi:hypothetical protein
LLLGDGALRRATAHHAVRAEIPRHRADHRPADRHFRHVEQIVRQLGRVVGGVKTADWVLDLGPEGGVKGGEIVAQGVPEKVAEVEGSITGRYLKPLLGKKTRDKPVQSEAGA